MQLDSFGQSDPQNILQDLSYLTDEALAVGFKVQSDTPNAWNKVGYGTVNCSE